LSDLKIKLTEAIDKVDEKSIYLDLETLIEDINFLKNLSKNIKEILPVQIKTLQ
jgi:hypothetical protein